MSPIFHCFCVANRRAKQAGKTPKEANSKFWCSPGSETKPPYCDAILLFHSFAKVEKLWNGKGKFIIRVVCMLKYRAGWGREGRGGLS